jgi:hypothetical protein
MRFFLVFTKREYTYENLHDLTATRAQKKLYKQHGFDLEKYLSLEKEIQHVKDVIREIEQEYKL